MENIEIFVCTIPGKQVYAEGLASDSAGYDYNKFECCPNCGRGVSGAYWEHPRELILTKKKLPDFLYTYGSGVPFAVSENVYEKLRAANINGIVSIEELDNIRFQRKALNTGTIPKYYLPEFKRSRITLNHETSKISYGTMEEGKVCSLCNPVAATYDFFDGICFDLREYEGYDVFKTYEMGDTVFFTKKFVDFCLENNFTNFSYTPISEYGSEFSEFFFE